MRQSARGGRLARVLRGSLALVVAAAVAPTGASAVERVRDGSFDASSCGSSFCTSPSWTTDSQGEHVIGPICGDPAATGAPLVCAKPSGTGYDSPNRWATLGDSGPFLGTDDRPPPTVSSISQDVLIPAL